METDDNSMKIDNPSEIPLKDLPIFDEAAISNFVEKEDGSALIEAVAGAGKSWSMGKALKKIPSTQRVLMTAFNTDIMREFESLINSQNRQESAIAKNFHSLGNSLLPKHSLSESMVFKSAKEKAPLGETRYRIASTATDLVSKFKNTQLDMPGSIELLQKVLQDLQTEYGLGPSLSSDERKEAIIIATLILDPIRTSVQMKRLPPTIDYDDQVWLPVVAKLKVPSTFHFDWIFVDEVQDLSPVQLQLLKMIFDASVAAGKKTRILAAGDRFQSIYSFRGAVNTIPILLAKFQMRRFSLPLCFRCPKSHVALAKKIVSHITPCNENSDGQVVVCKVEDVFDYVADGDWILCRNTKPLVETAFKLVKKMGKPAAIVGEASLKRQLTGFFRECKDGSSQQDMKTKANNQFEAIKKNCFEIGRAADINFHADFYECVRYLIDTIKEKAEILGVLKAIFKKENGSISCSSIHRSKGKSIQGNVWILVNSFTPLPSLTEFAEEEQRIWYVGVTRCKDSSEKPRTLYFAKLSHSENPTTGSVGAIVLPKEFSP